MNISLTKYTRFTYSVGGKYTQSPRAKVSVLYTWQTPQSLNV